VDRLTALVLLRFRLDVRAVLGARSRIAGLLVALPALGLFSLAATFIAATLARLLERSNPALTLPSVSAIAALLGLSWAFSPMLAGVQATETHDLGKLLHYPVPLPTLVGSSLLANWTLVAILLRISDHARRPLPEPSGPSAVAEARTEVVKLR
jgi:hypothetical protein